MNSIQPKLDNNMQLSSLKNNIINDTDSISTLSFNSLTNNLPFKVHNLASNNLSNQETSEKKETSNSNVACHLDELFINLVKRVKIENAIIVSQKNSLSRQFQNLYKTRIQSTIEVNNVNPSNQLIVKHNKPIPGIY